MNKELQQTLLARVYEVAEETPLQYAHKLSQKLNNNVYLKREDLQPVHSFKLRGAYNKIAQLSTVDRTKGVIAVSAGNHAQGVALAAQKLGISALIVMPRTTPPIKVEAARSYGAEIVLSGDSLAAAFQECTKLVKKTSRIFIHPFDDPLVIAGQGTIGREILEQRPDVTHIFIPVGGGGLIAGISQYVKQLKPGVKIIGVEPQDSNAMQASLKAGKRITLHHAGTFVDAVAVKQVGKYTFKRAQKYVDEVITVTTDQICAAIKNVFEETRSIVEPAGALGVAGLEAYARRQPLNNKQLVAISSGANMTFERLQFVAERTLLGSGQEALFSVRLSERPGALLHFCEKVVNGHSITEFNYRLQRRTEAHILVGINVSGQEDKKRFIQKMTKQGYRYLDLHNDDLAKEHVRHMIGGTGSKTHDEHLYEINFPERPGALGDFLQAIGDGWNISLFHYRGQGGDIGRVLIGFEATDIQKLELALGRAAYDFAPVRSKAAKIFL